jgi:RimJ/RimL family protein N-acetyltransferase
MEIPREQITLPFTYGKIFLRKMERADVDGMARWPFHMDPFYSRGANLPGSSSGRDRWWRDNYREPYSTILAGQDARGNLVGRVSVTLVDEPAKEGVMGIRIRADLEGQGLGADLLCAFLKYWFELRQMETLCFDAITLNEKAVACYRNVGVPIVGYHYEYHPNFLPERRMHKSGFLKYFDFRVSRKQYLELVANRKTDLHPV